MKQTLLSLVAMLGISSFMFAQISISYDGNDYTNGEISLPAGSGTISLDVVFTNNSGSQKVWTIQRDRVNQQSGWSDYMCWGHETDPFGGSCYSSSQMDQTSWTTPDNVTLEDSEAGKAKIYVTTSDPDMGPGTYRYTVVENGQLLDYVDVTFTKTAEVEELNPTVSLAPNPASDYIKVSLANADKATVKIIDVLGNVVLKNTSMNATKYINTSSFRNGVYFVIVEAEGVDPINKKVIVRH